MARKVKIPMKSLELPLGGEIIDRRPVSPVTPLYLMRRRVHKLTISPVKNRVRIAVEANEHTEISHPVKIVHVD